jgi:hypothetical protein
MIFISGFFELRYVLLNDFMVSDSQNERRKRWVRLCATHPKAMKKYARMRNHSCFGLGKNPSATGFLFLIALQVKAASARQHLDSAIDVFVKAGKTLRVI